jgi:lipopolysaccharide biosynthesis protein/GT2 family glycosyltransferase/ADP-heptose:LPS heptosyltransferase/tetratricopeptide (TPR) repeat protein
MLRLYRRPPDPSPIMLGDSARDAGQWEAAAHHYRTALLRNPERAAIWVQYGHALKESGKLLPAEAAYRRALDEAPSDADAHLQLGHVLKLQGRIDDAKSAYRRALALAPLLQHAPEELDALGENSSIPAEGPPERDGKAPATRRRRRRPSIITRADRARDLGEWGTAARLYREALDRNPRNASIWMQYGHASKEAGQLLTAEMAYRQALLIDATPIDWHLHLGHVLKAGGRTEEACASYLRAFILSPSPSHPSLGELSTLGWAASELAELLTVASPTNAGMAAEPSTLAEPPTPAPEFRHGNEVTEPAVDVDFDRDWYLWRYPDIAAAGIDPLTHYLHTGVIEGRNPNPTSDTPALRSLYCRGAPFTVGNTAKTPDLFVLRSITPRGSIAVVLHLFDHTLWTEMRDAISRIQHPFDLFISLTRGHSDHMRALILESFPGAYIFDFDDHGRDLGTFFVFLQSGVLFKYDLVCKLHTKRSPHLSDGDAWRQALIAGVLGSPALIDQILDSFSANPDIGIVVAEGQIYRGTDQWTGNKRWLDQLLPRIGISIDVEGNTFPGGSIFWIRSFLLRTIMHLGIQLSDFDPEPMPQDGALAHAIERIFGLVCEDAGMRAVEHTELRPSRIVDESKEPVSIIAFYLPQFHPVPENDEWWGKGFTEWTNVVRAQALFPGHFQPRLPADLGFYDLRMQETREAQVELARKYGVSAFCYYYYWFNGRRILAHPLNEVLDTGKPDFPFLICWANEPWTRNWDGLDQDVLLPQTYEPGWESRFAHDVAPLLRDPRYFRLDGKPMLLIYRVGHIPQWSVAARTLRAALCQEGIPDLHLAGAWATFPGDSEPPSNPAALGLDAYFEFPPHMTERKIPDPCPADLPTELGGIYDYTYTARAAIEALKAPSAEKRHKGVMVGWDNTPRRCRHAHIFYGATPANFRRWLRSTIVHERGRHGERAVFINAWNEWAEGTYLEPDQEFGHGWLEAIASAAGPSFVPEDDLQRSRIQVHRRAAVGDVLLTTPVLKALRKKYPSDQIVVSTEYPDLLIGNPFVDAVLRSPAPLPGFDKTIELEYESWPNLHIVEAYARIAGVEVTDRTPEIYLSRDERGACVDFLRDIGVDLTRPFCVMQLVSGWSVRDWPIERFKVVANALEREGVCSVVLGDRPEPAIDFGLDLRGKTTLRQAAAVVEKCALMVTIDSLLMHIGYAFRRPVVSLFGCTDPENRVPDWALPTALYSDTICRGCHHRQRPVPVITAPKCPWDRVLCMESLAAGAVIDATTAELIRANTPLVSIVIPHYNKWEMLHECICSIFRCGARVSFEVIVVADGSPDESRREIGSWEPNITVVILEPNQGFSKACNAGAQAAHGKYLLFLNDDTTVTPGWLDELVSFMQRDAVVGIAGPKLLYPSSNAIQHCGTVFNEEGLGEHLYRLLPGNFAPANRARFYRALTGACLMIEKILFDSIGQFDTTFHGSGGCEDTDLCFRVLAAGKFVGYCPWSEVYHHEGQTRGLRGPDHPEDFHNRAILGARWEVFLQPDIEDYCLLAAIEAAEGKTWRWLQEVPKEIIVRYESPTRRTPIRAPFRVQIVSGPNAVPDCLPVDSDVDAGSVKIGYDRPTRLPFHDGTLGEIIAIGAVEHTSWHELPHVLREFHRTLALGGRLVIRGSHLNTRSRRSVEVGAGADSLHVNGPVAYELVAAKEVEKTRQNENRSAGQGSAREEQLPTLCVAAGFSNVSMSQASDVIQ